MPSLAQLNIKVFCDGADFDEIRALAANPLVKGFTTNPSLMRRAGVGDYEAFARALLGEVGGRPVSLEVFADDIGEMERQVRAIARWGDNAVVKLPVTTTRREFTGRLIARLSAEGIRVNVTAVMTLDQVRRVAAALDPGASAIVSVFAGRIADTGVDPVPHMSAALRLLAERPRAELLWASSREALNVFQANAIGCHIITVTPDILARLALAGRDLDGYSLDTVAAFHKDAAAAGYVIR